MGRQPLRPVKPIREQAWCSDRLWKRGEICALLLGVNAALLGLRQGSFLYLSSGLRVVLCQKQNQRPEHLPPGIGLVAPYWSSSLSATWEVHFVLSLCLCVFTLGSVSDPWTKSPHIEKGYQCRELLVITQCNPNRHLVRAQMKHLCNFLTFHLETGMCDPKSSGWTLANACFCTPKS